MGWRRYLFYMRHRLGRMEGTGYSIAAGFASGAAMSMTPFMGFHFILSALLAWVLRGNLLASAIGTVVGNPWTFPLIFFWTYKLGCFMLGTEGLAEPFEGLAFSAVLHDPWQALKPVLWPMIVGSAPTAFVVWWVSYWLLLKLIEQYKRQRTERRRRRALEIREQRQAAREKNDKADFDETDFDGADHE